MGRRRLPWRLRNRAERLPRGFARHGRWYIPRREPRWLRRNALVALGNIGSSDDAGVVAALRDYAAGPDELLAEHAQWALEQVS